jgi:uncharacterized protein (DUF1015 family)
VKQVACQTLRRINEKEAGKKPEGNPYSFYHVIKPEIDFPDDFDHYAPDIYIRGVENFKNHDERGCLFPGPGRMPVIYCQTMNGRKQYGM